MFKTFFNAISVIGGVKSFEKKISTSFDVVRSLSGNNLCIVSISLVKTLVAICGHAKSACFQAYFKALKSDVSTYIVSYDLQGCHGRFLAGKAVMVAATSQRTATATDAF